MVETPIETEAPCVKLRTRFTRLGLHFVFVAIFAMAGGAVRGFNLLLVLAGFLIAVLLIQWRCSRKMMECVSVRRRLPSSVFAGQPFQVDYAIFNHHRLLPAWMIRVDDEIVRAGNERRKFLQFTTDIDIAAGAVSCGVGHVGKNDVQHASAQCVVHRRGRYLLEGTRLSSTFPFSLLYGIRSQDDVAHLDVFPKLLTVHRQWQQHLSPTGAGGAATARRSGVNDGEFYGLRPWQRGDSPRQIHWRTTARIGDLAVRQTEASKHLHACFLIDGYLPSQKFSHQETLESTISLAATLAIQLSNDLDDRVCMVVAGKQIAWTDAAVAQSSAKQSLHLLSSLIGSKQVDLLGALDQACKMNDSRRSLIVLSTRSLREALAATGDAHRLESQLSTWQRRSFLKWIDVSDPHAATWFAKKEANGQETSGTMQAQPSSRSTPRSEMESV